MTELVAGVVKFFNQNKGFGFLARAGFPDAFIRKDVAEAYGKPILRHAPIVANVNTSLTSGLRVTEIFHVGQFDGDFWLQGVLRWYNAEKGFGFVDLPGGTPVYLNRKVAEPSGLALAEGMPVDVVMLSSVRGYRAAKLRAAAHA